MKKDVAGSNYPFEWLDELVMVKLNPDRNPMNSIPDAELEKIENQLSFEIWTVFNHLKARTFGLKEKKLRAFLQHFHDNLIVLISRAKLNLAALSQERIIALSESIVISLEELLREIERRYGKYLPKEAPAAVAGKETRRPFKVLCRLSVDQLGILFKAADDSKLILCRSISFIFRSVVPFLSTDKATNISWMSMRKSSYQFQTSDLDRAVAVLQMLIDKIREYY